MTKFETLDAVRTTLGRLPTQPTCPVVRWHDPFPSRIDRDMLVTLANMTRTVNITLDYLGDQEAEIDLLLDIASLTESSIAVSHQFTFPNEELPARLRDMSNRVGNRPVTHVLYDQEWTRVGSQSNQVIKAIHDNAYDAAKSVFPMATVDWWQFRHLGYEPRNDVFVGKNFATDDIKHDAFTISLNTPEDITGMVKSYQAFHDQDTAKPKHAWVFLGSGIHRYGSGQAVYQSPQSYPSFNAWLMGMWCRKWSTWQGTLRLIGIAQPIPLTHDHPFWTHLAAFWQGLSGAQNTIDPSV